jgi:hypothetical protein
MDRAYITAVATPTKLTIEFGDETLTLEYDRAALTLSMLASGRWYDILTHALLDWDMTLDGKKDLPENFDRYLPAEERAKILGAHISALPIDFSRKVARAIHEDFMDRKPV